MLKNEISYAWSWYQHISEWQLCEGIYNEKDKNGTSTTKADTSSIGVDEHPILNNNQVEELKHQFLYINESQKVSDRMY